MVFKPDVPRKMGGINRFSDKDLLNSSRKYLITISVALLLLAVAPALAAAQDGASIYSAQCQSCHGADGTGIGLPNQPDFTDASFWEVETQEALRNSVANGVGSMPGFGSLSDAEIDAVLSHEADFAGVDFGSLPESGGTPTAPGAATPTATPIPGDAANGRAIYTGEQRLTNGGPSCISCHSVQGEGGSLGGGALAADLTNTYGTFGAGLSAWLSAPGNDVMRSTYADRPMTEQERADLTAFFESVNDRQPAAAGSNAGMFAGIGVIGFIIVAVIFSILWRGRYTKRNNGTVHDDLWRNYGGKK